MMFTEALFFVPILFQVSSKFFIADVEADVEMPQFKPFKRSPLMEKTQEATSSGIKSGSGTFGKVDKVVEHGNDYNDQEAISSGIKSGSGTFGKVDKVAEHGNDYNDYGSFFMGGKHRNV